MENLWQECTACLRAELPVQQFNTWIRPLKAEVRDEELRVLAPNRFVLDWVRGNYLARIKEVVGDVADGELVVSLQVTGRSDAQPAVIYDLPETQLTPGAAAGANGVADGGLGGGLRSPGPSAGQVLAGLGDGMAADAPVTISVSSRHSLRPLADAGGADHGDGRVVSGYRALGRSRLNPQYTFDNFIEGNSNQLARAAALKVVECPGKAYNPLFIYGGVGLGKTHLMHAIGNVMGDRNPNSRIVCLNSETFVSEWVSALRVKGTSEFKRFYRSAGALLIDDVQFFEGKGSSQEEFFYTFNSLLEGGCQIVLTCDRIYREIKGLEDSLKSRCGWGLSVCVEPPDLETRAAILIDKAEAAGAVLSNDAALFIAKRLRSNVRDLEGALKRVVAHGNFTGQPITEKLIKNALRDLFAVQGRLVGIDTIQRAVADHYHINMRDMLSKCRSRSVARPRQLAMCLSKELTNNSLPEIGRAFGGRDHTTVLYACKKIKKLREELEDIEKDYKTLLRSLSS